MPLAGRKLLAGKHRDHPLQDILRPTRITEGTAKGHRPSIPRPPATTAVTRRLAMLAGVEEKNATAITSPPRGPWQVTPICSLVGRWGSIGMGFGRFRIRRFRRLGAPQTQMRGPPEPNTPPAVVTVAQNSRSAEVCVRESLRRVREHSTILSKLTFDTPGHS